LGVVLFHFHEAIGLGDLRKELEHERHLQRCERVCVKAGFLICLSERAILANWGAKDGYLIGGSGVDVDGKPVFGLFDGDNGQKLVKFGHECHVLRTFSRERLDAFCNKLNV
jgi:hypothetical protein